MTPELRAVRAVLRGRRDRADASEVTYRIYLAIMLIVIVGAPLGRGLVLWTLEVLPEAGSPLSGQLTAVLVGATALCVLAGAQTGPARAGLPQLDLLFTSAIPRPRLLASSVWRGIALGAGVGACAAGLVVVVRLVRADLDPGLGAALLLAGAGLGAIAVTGTLLGQLSRSARWVLAGALAALAALHLAGDLTEIPAVVRITAGAIDPWSWGGGRARAAAAPPPPHPRPGARAPRPGRGRAARRRPAALGGAARAGRPLGRDRHLRDVG